MLSFGDIQSVSIANLTTASNLVAAPGANRRIVVMGMMLSLDAAGEITLATRNADDDGDVALMGTMEITADTPLVVPVNPDVPLAKCLANRPLRFTASSAANGMLWYAVVRA